jgi:hypothetical protein
MSIHPVYWLVLLLLSRSSSIFNYCLQTFVFHSNTIGRDIEEQKDHGGYSSEGCADAPQP